ncbi:MAG TPA: DUF481 domain-containing protein [Thermoanaerobaculia bacterium]|nr:DUF481 domain-containing protein [Thermoanaerobaculia bacterium]
MVLSNGDRITGEIKTYGAGKLTVDTTHSGWVKIKWSLIVSIESDKQFEIELTDARKLYGSLAPTEPVGRLAVITASGPVEITFFDVFALSPVFRVFWKRWEGSLDLGFNYTSSSSLTQFNLDFDAIYRMRDSRIVNDLSVFFSRQNDVTGASRASFSSRYEQFLKGPWVIQGGIGLERNVQLGLDLRLLAGAAAGYNVIQTNQAQLTPYLGIVGTHEQPVEGASGYSVEGVVGGRYTYFMYDFPKLTIAADAQVYPSFTVGGRVRLEATASAKREIISDFYLSISIFDSFDNRDPSTGESKNDWGPTVSIGWQF